MICARPRASLASVLLTLSDSAALAWRASTQITGRPASFNSWNSQLDSCPLSSPIRTAWGACCFTADAMASGVESTWPRHTILSTSSMTQIDVSFSDTSRPTYCLLWDMVSLLGVAGGKPVPAVVTPRLRHVPTCTRNPPARAAAVKDGPPSGHRASGAIQ
jgi:hypothetical protein